MTAARFNVPMIRSPDKQSLEFFTCSHRRRISDSKESTFAWVTYSLRPSQNNDLKGEEKDTEKRPPPTHPTFDLIRSYDASNPYQADLRDLQKIPGFILLPNILNWEFHFWDPKNKKFVDSVYFSMLAAEYAR